MKLSAPFIGLACLVVVAECRPRASAEQERPTPVTPAPPPAPPDQPPARKGTQLLVEKQAHRLSVVVDGTIVKSYRVALGSGGMGQKRVEGDRVTPIGTYTITGRYPSRWHTYLSLSYPNEEDNRRFAELAARGSVDARKGPGSAIAIHGHRGDQRDKAHKERDWTLGCVALDNDEIDEVAALSPVGTPVIIEE